MHEFQHTVTTADGIRLFVRESLPDGPAARRNLVFVHGVCEHGGRYTEFTQYAVAEGWRVLIPDQRGHGLSTGGRVHVRNFDEYVDDLRLICRHFSLDPQRTVVVGHSMGALVVARFLEGQTVPVAAACMLSPYLGLRIHVDRFTLILGQIVVRIWPWFRFRSRVRAVDLSRDEAYLAQRRQDGLVQRSVTAGWFFAVQNALQQAHAQATQISVPLLVMQGEQDHVVDPQATLAWFQSLRNEDRTLDMLPDYLHELLQETKRQHTIRRILDWLHVRVPS